MPNEFTTVIGILTEATLNTLLYGNVIKTNERLNRKIENTLYVDENQF